MRSVPRPGPVHGLYPQRPDATACTRNGLVSRWIDRSWRQLQTWRHPMRERLAAVRASQVAWSHVAARNWPAHLHRLRARLGREGWHDAALRAQALGCVAEVMHRHLKRNPFDTQVICAECLLQGCLAEMATGEGKTLAVALAAAVAALAGVPVHVLTANDYLAQRDAEQLAPFFQALGLRHGVVRGSSTPEERRAAYAGDITYATAREVAFDHLRDRQQLQTMPTELQQRAARWMQGEEPVAPLLMRGLCMALVDEADSLLIDEATMPLVLSEAVDDPRHRAWCFQALALARGVALGRHAEIDETHHRVHWTTEGEDHLHDRASALGGAWLNARHRLDLVGSALLALHALRRDEHYIVDAQGVRLLDAHTGRAASGRVWSRGLHTLVEMKEGCKISPPTRTTAQTSYQRFFSRYLHLAGTSGTLQECRGELSAVYGLTVVAVPLRQPSRRQLLPPRHFVQAQDREAALAQRVQALRLAGRPVLVGMASVEQADRFSARLRAAGIAHERLDARHDGQEAAVLARAGQPSQVTLATAMAGRGTDIHLAPAAAARGGLHVIVCQDNRNARLDRQFIGRCARQGDPGSAELWLLRETPGLPGLGLRFARAWQQRLNDLHDRRRRRRVWEEDLSWEQRLDFQHLHA